MARLILREVSNLANFQQNGQKDRKQLLRRRTTRIFDLVWRHNEMVNIVSKAVWTCGQYYTDATMNERAKVTSGDMFPLLTTQIAKHY